MVVKKPKFRSGFTLIELLVVISIIVLLIAILLPTLGKSKALAVQVVCGTRMSGLSKALRIYFAEWEGTCPTNGLILPKPNLPLMYTGNDSRSLRMKAAEAKLPDQWRVEFGALWTYVGGPPIPSDTPLPLPATPTQIAKAYLCPADMPDLRRTLETGASNPENHASPLYLLVPSPGANPVVKTGPGAPGYWSYSVNSVLNSLGRFRDRFLDASGNGIPLPWSDPFKESSMKYNNASEFITFIEEGNGSLFNDEVMDAPAYSQGDMLTDRHNFGGNVAFLDAHVEYFKTTVFNYQPSAISGTYVDHSTAMASSITRMFFPDAGRFASSSH